MKIGDRVRLRRNLCDSANGDSFWIAGSLGTVTALPAGDVATVRFDKDGFSAYVLFQDLNFIKE